MNEQTTEDQTQEVPDRSWVRTDYVVAENATGRILYTGTVPRKMIDIQIPPEGASVVIGMGAPETHYVVNGAVVPRPVNTATPTGNTLTNLPVPCTISIDETAHDCADDHCELSFSHPGTYNVTVSAWPMLDVAFEVTQP